ncbi:hypothetical protein B0H66DRAFT_624279 [Apodospora peruviana]|uniref:Polyketide synthase n=1 Tax=Apodospora peruviana TaxID=516989 RepID=A0AAE0I858_9PEZI|nr:hypothetical protein B0H66DRAFT_624279 [Apodospora peruviana]
MSELFSDESVMSAACEVACHNSPGMTVLSGPRPELVRIEVVLKERKIKCRLLDVPYAMHSLQMDGILPDIRKAAQGVRFGSPKVKVISTFSGKEHANFDSEYLVRHTREPVKPEQTIAHCVAQGLVDSTALWLEIGPNPVCLSLARSNTTTVSSDRALPSLKKGDDNWKTASAILASCYKSGKSVHWREYHRDFVHNSLSLITLPKYAFDTRNFWMPYTAPAAAQKPVTDVQPISTCLHHLVKQEDDGATFTTVVQQPALLKMIQGHKLSGITVCPAGVFSEMALTAARYLLTGGSMSLPFQPFIQVSVTRRRKDSSEEFELSIADQVKPSVITSKCVVRMRDEHAFALERRQILTRIQPRIASLKKAAADGQANRFQGKLFYKLFANLMDYADRYEGVQSAVVSDDFTEALATVRLPALTASEKDCTLSPYWIDALTHLAGLLFNGNPMSAGDHVYIGTHMERMEILAKNFDADKAYTSYAVIEHPEGSDIWRGHVYILDLEGGSVVGFLEGARFRKMPRTTLQRILGKPMDTTKHSKQQIVGPPSTNGTAVAVAAVVTNGVNGHHHAATSVNGTTPPRKKSLISVLIEQLIEETGMDGSELSPQTFFAEISVDSLMSIWVLAAVKGETGVELNASFLMDLSTLRDAQRELALLESRRDNNSTKNANDSHAHNTNGTLLTTNEHHDDDVNNNDHDSSEKSRECNVVLMQGPLYTPYSSPNSQPPLFLLADGAGSAAAYIHLPKLGATQTVYAVESAFVTDPLSFTTPFAQTAALYLAAIRAKQPHGPYVLGGWSAGGVFAYEVARLLLNNHNERVLGLIIIDITGPRPPSPNKFVAEPTMEIIDQIGMLSGIDRLNFDDDEKTVRPKQHMLATTFVVWATRNVIPKTDRDKLPAGLDAWFYPAQDRVLDEPNGWELPVGGNRLEISQVEGDHFSIMTAPEVRNLDG